MFITLFNSPYLLPYLAIFLTDSTDAYRLFSFCKVPYYKSIQDYDDIVKTIVANQLGVKVFIYPWSDHTKLISSNHQHIVHNDIFLWGPIMKDFSFGRSKCKNIYCIGCYFSNNYNDKSKKELREKMGLDINKSIVTFYTASIKSKSAHSNVDSEDFIQVMIDFAKKNPNVQVVLRPKFKKTQTDVKYKDILKKCNIKILDYRDAFIADVVKASDVNVSMGMNTTTTISLMCGIPGLYYDKTENHMHPLTRYEGQLTFRNREKLLNQIENLLEGTTKIPEIPELRRYNIFDTDPLEILRKYVKYGTVDEKYRLKVSNKG